jgi:hypothetical protein
MELHQKLNNYFEENGVQRKWFAKKIGISPQLFYGMLCGQQKLTSRLWKSLIELTGGYITIGDILKQEFKNIDYMTVIEGDTCDKCQIIIKDLAKKT